MDTDSPPSTPIHDRFSLHLPHSPPSPKKQVVVPSLPRISKATAPAQLPSQTTVLAGTRETALATTASNTLDALLPNEGQGHTPIHSYGQRAATLPDVDDGPLFRALVASNERRCKALRASLKAFVKVGSDAVDSIQERAACEAAVDASLDALSANSSLSDTLSNLWD